MAEKFKYSEDQINDLLDGIYAGTITEYNIPHDLYFAIADYLKSGVYQGFGGDLTKFTGKDLELLNELRENTYLFSGGKAFHQIKDYRSLLFDESGELRSKKDFTQLGHQSFNTWNDAWGLSERQTAIGQAQMASKWQNIEANADLLPILVFDTAGHPCEICDPYNGFSAPVSDPVWGWLTPLLHFNCECILRQEEQEYGTSSKADYNKIVGMKDTVSPEFRMNPGKDKIIFSSDHPYFQVDKKDLKFAKKNFNLPVPTMAQEVAKTTESTGGLSVNAAATAMKKLPISAEAKQAIHDYTAQSYYDINNYLRGVRKTVTSTNKKTINELSKFLDEAPKVEAKSYRGLVMKKESEFSKFASLKEGDVFTDNGFFSTSANKGVSTGFFGIDDKYQVEMVIKGKRGVLIENYSDVKSEHEILFNKGSNFKIESSKLSGKPGHQKIVLSLVEL